MEPTEWVRRRGSEFKLVHVDVDAKRFEKHIFTQYDNNDLGYLLMHIFVIVEVNCYINNSLKIFFNQNEEIYNNSAKSLFNDWIGFLRSRLKENWKVIIVPDDNAKSKNKFTINKFVLANKLKSDFNITKLDKYFLHLLLNSFHAPLSIRIILIKLSSFGILASLWRFGSFTHDFHMLQKTTEVIGSNLI